jgi:hypothetical protein
MPVSPLTIQPEVVNAQNRHGLQVGKVAIRIREPWNPRVSMGRNIHLFGAAKNDDHLSQRLRWAVDDFEVALKQGEPILRWLSYLSRSTPGSTGLLRRLRALCFFCISVGAALCERLLLRGSSRRSSRES